MTNIEGSGRETLDISAWNQTYQTSDNHRHPFDEKKKSSFIHLTIRVLNFGVK